MSWKRLKSQIGRLESSKEKRIPNFRPNSISGFAVSETKKPPSQNFPEKYRWFCGERNQKTTESKFTIISIGGFALSETKKPPSQDLP